MLALADLVLLALAEFPPGCPSRAAHPYHHVPVDGVVVQIEPPLAGGDAVFSTAHIRYLVAGQLVAALGVAADALLRGR